MSNQLTKSQVIKTIQNAFKGTTLNGGIGLLQGRALDDYNDTPEHMAHCRAKEESEDWTKISADDMETYQSSLSFVDAKGMRFLLPAYMIGELNDEAEILFHVVQSVREGAPQREYGIGMFAELDAAQVNAVKCFLEYLLKDEDYEYDHDAIRGALDEYWNLL
eukprot:TRINITY_DN8_c1_g2_i3.p1 TRINITY_DN8_c1_g2~~TRINITY_DN8_c1_g2_i3.p1  ORF type:complete len:163 (+),score=25.14 TRINITY_DN8_c1_g2_i3:653-1141(+)